MESETDRRYQTGLDLLKQLDAQQKHLETAIETQEHSRYQEMATRLLFDPKTKDAFDVHGADPKLQDRYGRNAT